MTERSKTSGFADRARGLWLGQIIGDALGTTLEFSSAASCRRKFPDGLRDIIGDGPFRLLPGQVTDDTELALALARALIAHGADLDAVARAYVGWKRSRPFDCGNTTAMALRSPHETHEVRAQELMSQASLTSQANGSLMRISPWALYGADKEVSWVQDWARSDSRLTHPHPACQEACAIFVTALLTALEGGSPREVMEAARSAITAAGRAEELDQVLEKAEATQPSCDGQHQGWVRIALQNAFYQLLHADSFEEGLVSTVMAGGDTDTNACIAGALLGAVFGEPEIPQRWRDVALACTTPRPPTFQARDARELAVALVARGSERPVEKLEELARGPDNVPAVSRPSPSTSSQRSLWEEDIEDDGDGEDEGEPEGSLEDWLIAAVEAARGREDGWGEPLILSWMRQLVECEGEDARLALLARRCGEAAPEPLRRSLPEEVEDALSALEEDDTRAEEERAADIAGDEVARDVMRVEAAEWLRRLEGE